MSGAQRLNIEGRKHNIWLSEVEACDSKKESGMQLFRNSRALTRKLWMTCATPTIPAKASQTKLIDHVLGVKVSHGVRHPANTADQLSAPMWAAMPQIGLAHSRHIDKIFSYTKSRASTIQL